jgi:hypothetical protein
MRDAVAESVELMVLCQRGVQAILVASSHTCIALGRPNGQQGPFKNTYCTAIGYANTAASLRQSVVPLQVLTDGVNGRLPGAH